MNDNMHESGEMYLETIHTLGERLQNIRSIDIVKEMGFSKPSVSRAMNKLKDDGYIDIDGSGYITLTDAGERVAETIYERHLVLTEVFKKLGVDPEIAEEDACKIEHVISDETFQAIKKHGGEL